MSKYFTKKADNWLFLSSLSFSSFYRSGCRKQCEWSKRRFSNSSSKHQRTLRWHGIRRRPSQHSIIRRGAGQTSTEATPSPPNASLWAGTAGKFPWRQTGCRPQTTEGQEPTTTRHQGEGEGEPETVEPTGLHRETNRGQEVAQWRELRQFVQFLKRRALFLFVLLLSAAVVEERRQSHTFC